MSRGYFSLLLHAHLPFVRHPEFDDFLEEDWLFEAVAETYVPLLQMLHKMRDDRLPLKLTFTLTPTLCAMLNDPLLRNRTERYFERADELAQREFEKPEVDAAWRDLSLFYKRRFSEGLKYYRKVLNRDIVGAFAELQSDGLIEIATCAATHGFLPLMREIPQAVRAQIQIGCEEHQKNFGVAPRGIWLPECAYYPGVEEELRRANIHWFALDAHGVMLGNPQPRFAIFTPYFTPAGPAGIGRDRDSSRQVWSSREGYPGDPAYRDFYRDLGKDLPVEELRGIYGESVENRFTGLKYHQITGGGGEKALYNRAWAMAAADAHATDFMQSRVAQFEDLQKKMPVDFLVFTPFDAELFGHWWFEGPEFLNLFLRKAAYDQNTFAFTTPSDFLRQHPTQQILSPAASSWGNRGYWEVWLDECNHWIYPHLHQCAREMVRLSGQAIERERSEVEERTLKQLVRELLLAQSSDWAFLMRTGTASEYAALRTQTHVDNFFRLAKDFTTKHIDETFLRQCEERHNLFSDIKWQHYV
ncbi:MAG: glycoside hydrolase family 57 protein [Chthoniobacterales bacterium]